MAGVRYVDVGRDGRIWCIAEDGQMHYFKAIGDGQWSSPQGEAVLVSGGMNGEVWRINAKHRLMRGIVRNGNVDWEVSSIGPVIKIAGSNELVVPVSIAADGKGGLWVVRNNGSLGRQEDGQWIDAGARDARLVSARNSVIACYVNNDGELFARAIEQPGYKWRQLATPDHRRVQSVGCGVEAKVLWITDEDDNLHKWVGGPNPWERNGNGQAMQVAVGKRNVVWCVNQAGEMWHSTDPQGGWDTHWTRVPGPG